MPYQRTGPTPPRRARRARGAVMGYHLAAEVRDHCPDLPYRQYRLLVALALDATDPGSKGDGQRDRQAMPGMDAITLWSNAGRRTAMRLLDALQRHGLIKVVRRGAPGRRAVYEILPMMGVSELSPVSAGAAASPAAERVSSTDQRVTSTARMGDPELSPTNPNPKSSTKDNQGARPKRTPRTARGSHLIELTRTELKTATGDDITDAWASKTMLRILDGREVDNPAAYLRTVIRNEDDPRGRFLSRDGAHRPARRGRRDDPAPLGEAIAEMFGHEPGAAP